MVEMVNYRDMVTKTDLDSWTSSLTQVNGTVAPQIEENQKGQLEHHVSPNFVIRM